jgi:hypothetical protein
MRWLRWIAFILFLAALSGYQAYALFVEEPDLSQHMPPEKDVHLSREVYGLCQLSQTFVVNADGFSALEVFPKKSVHPPEGVMIVRVTDGRTETFTTLVNLVFDSASLDLSRPYRIPIPRVDDSSGRLFMLEVRLPDAKRGHGLLFEQGGPTYPAGKMSIDCQPDWGDLKFRTEVQRTTIFSNVLHLRRSLPPWAQSDVVLFGVLFLANLALAIVVYALAFAPDSAAREAEHHLPNGNAERVVARHGQVEQDHVHRDQHREERESHRTHAVPHQPRQAQRRRQQVPSLQKIARRRQIEEFPGQCDGEKRGEENRGVGREQA